jgi:hypothetical protein
MTLIPIQVTFRGLAHSGALEADIHEHAVWLEQFYPGIVRCRVLVELPHRHRRDGRHVHVRVAITVPHRDPIVISHEPSLHGQLRHGGEDAHRKETEVDGVHRYAAVAIREAFDAARRRLEDAAREQRGAVKTHEVPRSEEAIVLSEAEE